MRKALMMLVAVAALAIGFAGCQKADDTTPTEGNDTGADVETESPMEEAAE